MGNKASSTTSCARLFACAIMPLLAALCFALPPLVASDESSHFLRIVGLSIGSVIPTAMARDPEIGGAPSAGGPIDTGVSAFVRQIDKHVANKFALSSVEQAGRQRATGVATYYSFSNTALYPPLLYLPAIVAVAAARALDLPILWWLYIARLTNAVCGSLVCLWLLRRDRRSAPYLLVAATLPVTLFQLATVSADAMLMAAALVFASILSRVATRQRLTAADHVAWAVSTALIGVGKVAYLPLVFVPVIAFWMVDGGFSRRVLAYLLLATLCVVTWAGWASMVQDKVFSIRPLIHVEPAAQLRGMLASPFGSVAILVRAAARDFPRVVLGFAGSRLGHFAIELVLPKLFVAMAAIMLVIASLLAASHLSISNRVRWAVFGILASSYAAIYLLLYLQYNAVGATTVDGIQWRYMTPLIIILLAITPRIVVSGRTMTIASRAVCAWACISAVSLLTACLLHFWNWHGVPAVH
jgi:uncharacterized membrane protein